MRFFSIPFYCIIFSSVCFFNSAIAADIKGDSFVSSLGPVIITAARGPQNGQEILAPASVLTREDIQSKQFHSISDALKTLPGISISNQGGEGKLSSIFLRGTEADHVLVLIDGVKVGSASAGTTAFEDLPIESIERIEVVRGPLSSLYGAEAVGGVIQILTTQGKGGNSIHAGATLGSYNTRRATAGIQGSNERGWWSYQVKQEKTDGINACKGDAATFKGCYTNEPDKDGYAQQAHNFGAGWQFNDAVQAQFHWLRTDADNEYDGSFQNQAKNRQQVFSGQLDSRINSFWNMSWMLGKSEDDSRNLLASAEKSKFNTQKNTASWINYFQLNDKAQLTLGIDSLLDKINQSSTIYAVTSRDNQGLFTLLRTQWANSLWETSLRHDHNEQFGDTNTGTVRWGMDIPQDLRISLSWGNAFKAPTFNDLYYDDPNDPFYHGNPNLLPEKSASKEIGLDYLGINNPWSLHLFQTDFRDLIALNDNFDSSINVGKAQVTGLEAQWSTRWQNVWQLTTQATFLQPESKDSATDGNQLPRRSRQQLSMDLTRQINRINVGAQVFAQGMRYDNLANTTRLPGYALINLRAEYPLTKSWKLQAKVENLLDRDYETVSFYSQPGRSFFISVNYDGAN